MKSAQQQTHGNSKQSYFFEKYNLKTKNVKTKKPELCTAILLCVEGFTEGFMVLGLMILRGNRIIKTWGLEGVYIYFSKYVMPSSGMHSYSTII